MRLLLPLLLLTLNTHAQCVVKFADTLEQRSIEHSLLQGITKSDDCNMIRVVVHVIYDPLAGPFTSSGEISPQQVLSQLRITNQFFANDSLMFHEFNTEFPYQVVLANEDPFGNPTSGINYYDGVELFGESWHTHGLRNDNLNAISVGEVANALAWGEDSDGKKYLNSYIVSRIDGSSGAGVQAFAYFPTSSVVFGNYNLFNAFGSWLLEDEYLESFNLKPYTDVGHTWTHELLHNFAIFHTFHGNTCEPELNPLLQGDRIEDTPPQTQGQGCFGSCGFVSHNIMDYLSETCKNRITPGQVARASLVIQNSLSDYLVCPDCDKSGDVNGDGWVNITDASYMGSIWLSQEGDPDFNPMADLNCDGVINILDISRLQYFWPITFNELYQSPLIVYDITGRQVSKNITTPGVYIVGDGQFFTKVYVWE